ncbi:MAG: hypothetical protein QM695_06695 [Micropruina sp.]
MGVRDELIAGLAEKPTRVLSEWLWLLHVSGREFYPGADFEGDPLMALQGVNELTLVIAEQLKGAESTGELLFPVEPFIDQLNEKAALYGVGGNLRWSAEQALERVRG